VQQCSKCGQSFDAESCSFCGNLAQVSTRVGWGNDKSLNKSVVLPMVGLLGVVLAHRLYKPLDDDTLLACAMTFFFVSGGIGLWIDQGCKPTPWNLQFQKRLFAFMGVVLVLYSAFVILNGALDHYPLVQAETRVVRTYQGGKSNRGFFIVVAPSWRKGRNQEEFKVAGDFNGRQMLSLLKDFKLAGDVNDQLQTGDLVRVEVHRGAFWLPWGPTVINRIR